METLNGARIALLEGRMRGELAELVRRHGGLPCSVPAVEEAPLASSERVTVLLDQLTGGAVTVAVLLTGAGVRSLFAEAERLGRPEELRVALRTATTVCRGPKPVGALSQEGVPARVKAPAPHTTAELLGAMAPLDLHGAGVVVVHYGERNGPFAEALCARGARLEELCLYEWRLPADRGPLRALVRRLIDGDLDAIAFTSQVQLRHLLTVAGEMGQEEALLDALRSTLAVASIGPTCTAALRGAGIQPHVEPEHGKMGHLVAALARRFAHDKVVSGLERAGESIGTG